MEDGVRRMHTLNLGGRLWGVLATAVGAANGRSMGQLSQEEVRAAVRAIVDQQTQAWSQ